MARRHPGHQSGKQRRQGPGQLVDQAAGLADGDDAQPQGHQTDQADRQLHGQPGHVEQGCHHTLENCGVPQAQPLVERTDKSDEKETQPDAVQHRFPLRER